MKLTNTAIFTPAISPSYGVPLHNKSRIPNLPHGLHSLNFLSDEGLFNYPYALYSAGNAGLDLNNIPAGDRLIQDRNRNETLLLGDSGGFQIINGRGQLKDWSTNKDQLRHNILKWLEFTTDISMILDIPTHAINTGFANNFDECLKGTLENLDYFIKHRNGDKTRFLNVLQGRSTDEIYVWWSHVKDYPFSGWAFGGEQAANFYFLIKRLLFIRDNLYFEKAEGGYHNRDWIHVLGISRLQAAVELSIIQRELRKDYPKLSISYDSSTAFMSATKGQCMTSYSLRQDDWSYTIDPAPNDKSYKGSTTPWPWSTDVGRHLTLGDICVKDNPNSKTSWDSLSYSLVMAFNLNQQISAIQEANRLMLLPRNNPWVPSLLHEFEDIVHEIFQTGSYDMLEKNRPLLENCTGKKTGKGISMFDEMFA